jgi:hypothetical protein
LFWLEIVDTLLQVRKTSLALIIGPGSAASLYSGSSLQVRSRKQFQHQSKTKVAL